MGFSDRKNIGEKIRIGRTMNNMQVFPVKLNSCLVGKIICYHDIDVATLDGVMPDDKMYLACFRYRNNMIVFCTKKVVLRRNFGDGTTESFRQISMTAQDIRTKEIVEYVEET